MIESVRRVAKAGYWRFRCRWAVWRASEASERALALGPVRRIHVVCNGNIYRSPYAAALLRRLLAGRAEVTSSGFHQVSGRPSPQPIVDLAAIRGIDLALHRSSVANAAELELADLLVLMDRHNWQSVRRMVRDQPRIVWLGAMDGGGELCDPYGRSAADLHKVVDRLHDCTEILARRITAGHPSAPA